mgnify:CR=1 FL=1
MFEVVCERWGGGGGGGGGRVRTRTRSLPRLIIGHFGVSSDFRLSLFISEVQREDNSKICTDKTNPSIISI